MPLMYAERGHRPSQQPRHRCGSSQLAAVCPAASYQCFHFAVALPIARGEVRGAIVVLPGELDQFRGGINVPAITAEAIWMWCTLKFKVLVACRRTEKIPASRCNILCCHLHFYTLR